MPSVTIKGDRVPIKAWAPISDIESSALTQLKNITRLPWVAHHVAVMPDVHLGKGATVGSVIAMRGAVSPAAVGVDIGCGMAAVQTNLRADVLPDNLRDLRFAIEAAVPVGMAAHDTPAWRRASLPVKTAAGKLMEKQDDLAPAGQAVGKKASLQLGTLGGGNHFIEVCLDTADNVWLMLHSGSRNIGAQLAAHHMAIAKHLKHNEALTDRDLAAFLVGTKQFDAYRADLYWAQEYALINRRVMLELVEKVVRDQFPHATFGAPIECHHNYVAEEAHFGEPLLVTRKGAISARAGQLGIIPGSMGTRSYIVRGKGNADAYHSASHGAGRRMSRTQAKKSFSLEDLKRQTDGVECRKDFGVVDEAPHAYKKIETVMAQQQDLVEIVHELKQIVCVKG